MVALRGLRSAVPEQAQQSLCNATKVRLCHPGKSGFQYRSKDLCLSSRHRRTCCGSKLPWLPRRITSSLRRQPMGSESFRRSLFLVQSPSHGLPGIRSSSVSPETASSVSISQRSSCMHDGTRAVSAKNKAYFQIFISGQ